MFTYNIFQAIYYTNGSIRSPQEKGKKKRKKKMKLIPPPVDRLQSYLKFQ